MPNPLSWVRVALDEHYRAAARGMMAIAGAATFAGVDSDDSRRTAAGRGLDLDDIALREQRASRTPRLTDTRERARLHHLSEAEARQVVAESCFTPRDEFWVRPWLIPRQRADDLLQRQANSAVQHVTATVPCVEVSFGVRNPITELVHALEEAIGGIR